MVIGNINSCQCAEELVVFHKPINYNHKVYVVFLKLGNWRIKSVHSNIKKKTKALHYVNCYTFYDR